MQELFFSHFAFNLRDVTHTANFAILFPINFFDIYFYGFSSLPIHYSLFFDANQHSYFWHSLPFVLFNHQGFCLFSRLFRFLLYHYFLAWHQDSVHCCYSIETLVCVRTFFCRKLGPSVKSCLLWCLLFWIIACTYVARFKSFGKTTDGVLPSDVALLVFFSHLFFIIEVSNKHCFCVFQ